MPDSLVSHDSEEQCSSKRRRSSVLRSSRRRFRAVSWTPEESLEVAKAIYDGSDAGAAVVLMEPGRVFVELKDDESREERADSNKLPCSRPRAVSWATPECGCEVDEALSMGSHEGCPRAYAQAWQSCSMAGALADDEDSEEEEDACIRRPRERRPRLSAVSSSTFEDCRAAEIAALHSSDGEESSDEELMNFRPRSRRLRLRAVSLSSEAGADLAEGGSAKTNATAVNCLTLASGTLAAAATAPAEGAPC